MAIGDEQQQTKRSTSTGSSSPSSLRRRRNPPAVTALPQQERELTSMLPPPVVETDDRTPVSSQSSSSLEEEEEEGDDDDDDDVYDYDDEEELFLQSQQMEFSEGEDMNSDQLQEETEESDVDPDELSYEELIALEEMVGEENRGLPPEQISSYLRPYAPPCLRGSPPPIHHDRCVICQAEYEEGEMRVALSCQHLYHSDCIRKWLLLRKTCPICGIEVSSSSNVASTF